MGSFSPMGFTRFPTLSALAHRELPITCYPCIAIERYLVAHPIANHTDHVSPAMINPAVNSATRTSVPARWANARQLAASSTSRRRSRPVATQAFGVALDPTADISSLAGAVTTTAALAGAVVLLLAEPRPPQVVKAVAGNLLSLWHSPGLLTKRAYAVMSWVAAALLENVALFELSL
jgi:hypothetical protein